VKKLLAITLLLILTGCEQPRPVPNASPEAALSLEDVSPSGRTAKSKRDVSAGQIVYVPCYSHIRLADGRDYKLAINLSIRNTSQTESLAVNAVEYYNSSGVLVKDHANKELTLSPLATADFFVSEDDMSGGSGANFLVTWHAAKPISEPIIEAVMVGTGGSQGVSFTSTGRLLKETEPGS
jgi:hypothetical protein